VISLAEPYPHLLAESEQRCTQESDWHDEETGSAVNMLQAEEGTAKSHNKKQRCAHPTGKRQVRCAIQKDEPPPQARNVRFEAGTSLFTVGDVIQIANALNDRS